MQRDSETKLFGNAAFTGASALFSRSSPPPSSAPPGKVTRSVGVQCLWEEMDTQCRDPRRLPGFRVSKSGEQEEVIFVKKPLAMNEAPLSRTR